MKKSVILLSALAFGCGKSKDKEATTLDDAPNVCKSLAMVGTFPVNGSNVTTYAVACFEGFQIIHDQKWYLAPSKCGEGKLAAAQGDEMAKKFYEPFASKTCPLVDVIASCVMATAKAVVYKGSEEFFKKDAFTAYCAENKGVALFH